jgi:hypothetical protein
MPWQLHHLPRTFIRCERSYVIATAVVPWQEYHLPRNFIGCERSYVIATVIVPWQQYHLPRDLFLARDHLLLPRQSCRGNSTICHAILFIVIDHISTQVSLLPYTILPHIAACWHVRIATLVAFES